MAERRWIDPDPDDATVARFLAKVRFPDQEGGCWLWTASQNGKGYGWFRGRLAHRVSWTWANAMQPTDESIDHRCGNRACVNPAHLEPVSYWTNNHRSTWPRAQVVQTDGGGVIVVCANGHERTPATLYRRKSDGAMICRVCTREATRRYRERSKLPT